MNILNVNMSINPVLGGGTAERTMQASRFLAALGSRCSILTLDINMTDSVRARAGNVNVVAIPCLMERYYVPSGSRGILSECVASADVIQIMNHWTVLNAVVFHYVKKYRKPFAVCPAGALPVFGRSRTAKRLYNRLVGKRLIREANACVAVSSSEMEDFKKYGVPDDRISLIPNGVDPDDFVHNDPAGFREKFGLGDIPFILFMGRLNAIKGPDLLLKAYIHGLKRKGYPHHLVFAGPDGGMQEDLRSLCRESGCADRVHFIGYLGDTLKSDAYHAADMLVIPSRQEAMSIVVLEAGITGTPVLMTDRCGFRDIADIKGGHVVGAEMEELEIGLHEMLSNRDNLIDMGVNLRSFVRANFLWTDIARKYLELFTEIFRKKAA